MERDDLVFKAKLAEQAERYVFCALLRVARWFLRVDFELDDFDSRFHFFSFTERQKVNSFNDFSSRCGIWRVFDFREQLTWWMESIQFHLYCTIMKVGTRRYCQVCRRRISCDFAP